MCQEGAINMANKGFKYEDIIKFYYTNIHLFPFQFTAE
jgi:peptidoglycan hydrolase-like amidase